MFDLLEGLVIVDLTTIVLGPYATQFLGDLGANVIKVEAPTGDVFRAVRPGPRDDLGAAFLNFNRNKRSIAVDLKQKRGQEVLRDLAGTADALVHNMRGSSASKLGASYETLSAVNPKIVYCYSPGFGTAGPDSNAPAYDDIIQARSGLAALNADEEGAPQFLRTVACDKIVGLHLALAVVSGLMRRERTGRGGVIEVPMFETMATFVLAEHMAGHTMVPPQGLLGYGRVLSPNRKPYRTKDGFLAILPYTTRQWIRFFEIADRPELASDPRVTDPKQRSEHVDELYQLISEIAPTKPTAEWQHLLAVQDIPCSRVNSLEDLFTDAQLEATQLFDEVKDPRLGSLKAVRSPFDVDGEFSTDLRQDNAAPGLGANTREVLRELGYSDSKIKSLIEAGIVVDKQE